LVLVNDDGHAVAEVQDLETYDLSTTRGRAMLLDDILVALGHADRRVVLDMIRERRERAERAVAAARLPTTDSTRDEDRAPDT
jgi:RecJ-like exonuclease